MFPLSRYALSGWPIPANDGRLNCNINLKPMRRLILLMWSFNIRYEDLDNYLLKNEKHDIITFIKEANMDKKQSRDLFAFNFEEGLKQRIKLVAEIFEFPLFQFEVTVSGDKSLQTSLMQHSIEFYESTLQKLNSLDKGSRSFEQAKLQRPILGKKENEVREMAEHMDDRYYR
jgi:hypothetical protein